MKLILARHGNTFSPGDSVVWTGATNDLPLVSAGQEQARALAADLRSRNLPITRILAGPLKRTREYADIVLRELELPCVVEIDDRLTEVDYGSWTGLTNEEVAQQFGAREQLQWNERSVWPESADWLSSPAAIVAEVLDLVAEIQSSAAPEDTVLLVSSNGKLRYFLELVDGAFARHVTDQNFKVRTGAYCILEYIDSEWRVVEWNIRP